MRVWLPICGCVIALLGAVRGVGEDAAIPAAATRPIDFRRDIWPILSGRCFKCHHGADATSGRRLDDPAELLGETTGEPLVSIGDSQHSLLIELVAGIDPKRVMPPKGPPLAADEVALLRGWIDQGLSWDETLLPRSSTHSDHWAFQPVARPAVPEPSDWTRTPVDAFISEQHRERGLHPAMEADRRTMIRRLSLDLLGLPPDPAEVDAFTASVSPTAYEDLVERLLSSPQYGQRWGRHWLDVARWAESEGYESNHPRPHAWRYRDYVVASFNADRPFDEFLRQQLAGDELVPYRDENLIATGFLAAARLSSNEEDRTLQRNAVLVDIVNATGSAFLGLTLHCAQCHNHKFDPVSIRDYYSLQSFFLRGQPANVVLQDAALRAEYERVRPAEYEPARQLKALFYERGRQRVLAEIRTTLTPEMLAAVDTPASQRTIAQELLAREAGLKLLPSNSEIEKAIPEEDRGLYDAAKKRVEAIEQQGIAEPQAFAFYSPVTSPHDLAVRPMPGFYPPPFDRQELAELKPYLKVRGEVHRIGPTVATAFPVVFEPIRSRSRGTESQPGARNPDRPRAELADWLTDPRHPLTARVWVNRIWHYHFGRGLVATPGDFGVRGAKPSHPELLDWLAAELISSGWSTKHIHQLIVLSNTYRQSSTIPNESREGDPDNVFLTRWSPRRLESESLRDCLLAVSGELDRSGIGPSVPLNDSAASRRRSLYLFQKRGVPPDMQKLFDGPAEVAASCESRQTTTTSLQSLYLLNNTFVVQRATALAARLRSEYGDDTSAAIGSAFRAVLGRSPDDEEFAASKTFLDTDRDPQSFARFVQALMNLNEFAYIE